ncbi:Gfo/Idh/MocA family protein [Halorussus salinisoli]|nr:Gfo/Idh/MocA family oxidoreductase [Halorussus salinisoli]
MAYRHAAGYEELDNCDLVACSDLVGENARAFAAEFGIPDANTYEDYDEMLAAVEPDVVSVCTPVPTHAPIVIDCAESGHVDAIHCEKPMADTWEASREMATVCDEYDVLLTFNHQRRYGVPAGRIKQLLDDGEIGELQRLELAPGNFFDAGSHLVDLCSYFNDEHRAKWVMGQIDYREENVRYGVHNENQAFVQWRYENGVHAVAYAGFGDELLPCQIRVVGSEGVIELQHIEGPTVRVRRQGETEWRDADADGPDANIPGAVRSVVDALETGEESMLRAENALTVTEILFGAYESVRQRGRVDTPLEIDDNPIVSLVEAGEIVPEQTED